MSSLASETAVIVSSRLFAFLEKSPLGKLYSEQSFRCFPHDPDLIRRPDVSFVAAERLAGVPEEGHVPIAPDLAIEVVSPNDVVYDLDRKLADYRSAGVKLVWVFNPKARVVRIYRADHSVSELGEGDALSGEAVIGGFSADVAEMLPKKPGSPS